MADPRIKQIQIKTGVVKRQTKEKSMYEKEAQDLEIKLKKMTDDKCDVYDIRKQNEVLQESKMMIPDTVGRLRKSVEDLKQVLEKESDLAENEEYSKAKEILSAAEAVLSG